MVWFTCQLLMDRTSTTLTGLLFRSSPRTTLPTLNWVTLLTLITSVLATYCKGLATQLRIGGKKVARASHLLSRKHRRQRLPCFRLTFIWSTSPLPELCQQCLNPRLFFNIVLSKEQRCVDDWRGYTLEDPPKVTPAPLLGKIITWY